MKARLDLKVSDLGPTQLKNIAEPIHVYSLEVGESAVAKPAVAPEAARSAPQRLSMVVLPFANLSGNASQDYFVDGVTESLTTDLSRISGSFVMARNTAFTYKGKAINVKQIGRELNVRYVLEGSIQRGGDRMRVNVQLIEAESGKHLWADRFDKQIADLFEMQDEIVGRLANQLGAQLVAAEARSAERAPSPNSTDFYFQGMFWFNKGPTPENLAEARSLFQRAIDLDPRNVDALASFALMDAVAAANFHPGEGTLRFAEAESAANKALSLAPDHAWAHHCMGILLGASDRAAQALSEFARALTLDRNLAQARAWIGIAKSLMGCGEETESHVREALRLSPRDVRAFVWFASVGLVKVQLGDDEEALEWLRKSTEINRNYIVARYGLAAALANLGRLEEARTEAQTVLSIDPTFTITRLRDKPLSTNPIYLSRRERIVAGLRKAGVPEG